LTAVHYLRTIAAVTKRPVHLELFGQRLTVNTDIDPERVREIVSFVNHRLETIRESSKRVQTDQIALLAALNIAEELFDERREVSRLRKGVRERARALLERIDDVANEVDAERRQATTSGGVAG
jgi:cell division protein ZapA